MGWASRPPVIKGETPTPQHWRIYLLEILQCIYRYNLLTNLKVSYIYDELAIASSSTAKNDILKMNDKFTIFIIHGF
ncbi:MAG: hypothetical protein V7K85_02915 [Nostoc sp.]